MNKDMPTIVDDKDRNLKIYYGNNVVDTSLERMRWIFDEFEEVIVSFSGGKDSTIIFDLAMRVAKEKNKLPLSVLFIDQEAEYQSTIDMVKKIMYDPDVKPYWLQVEFSMENSSSSLDGYFKTLWGEDAKSKWLREKDPISIHECSTIPKETQYYDMFGKFLDHYFPNIKTVNVSGVRAEENPRRSMAISEYMSYKYITWGNKTYAHKGHWTLYPIYDWSYRDVWKYINEQKLEYCKIYDKMYSYGLPVTAMRVSSLIHAAALKSLYTVQELEPETYEKLVNRMSGISSVSQLQRDSFLIEELPYMFKDWTEYRDYLLKNIIQDEKTRKGFKRYFKNFDKWYTSPLIKKAANKVAIFAIMRNDIDFFGLEAFNHNLGVQEYRYYRNGTTDAINAKYQNKYLEEVYGDIIYTKGHNEAYNKKRGK